MRLDNSQILALFKEMYLFSGLDDAQLNWACSLFTQIEYPANTPVFQPGQLPDGFYIIGAGEVYLTQKIENTLTDVDVMVAGDFFGEEALLLRRPHQVAVTTVGETTLLKVDILNFNELILQFPNVRINLERMMQSRVFVRKHNFDWLNPDEVIYQVRRKHEAFLLVTLFWPTMIVLISLIIALSGVLVLTPSAAQTAFLILMGLIILAAGLWGAWNWIDWSNDYYIITNQRVVWIEQVIWLYDSRVEAPNNTIQAVDVFANYLGRLLGFGDVRVSTFTGRVALANVGEPKLMQALIQEQWHRSQRNYQKSEEAELNRTIRGIIHDKPVPPVKPEKSTSLAPPDDYTEPSLIATYFSNIFQMRFEKDNIITYRKHWISLLARAWKPMLTMVMILAGMLACGFGYYFQGIEVVDPGPVVGIGLLVLLLVVFPWWLYNYVDWRNDIYQLTDKNIFDIERRPFGTEIRKSAPLEKILTLEHERPGFLGYILNVGNVVINFGDTKLTFDSVYEPARIQTDIFTRLHQLRIRQQKIEVSRERERFLRMLEVYHQQVSEESEDYQSG
jgi:hypothetical protein